MANSKIKVYYFDGKGRIEAARLILVAAGKEFEDIRYSDDDWPKYRQIAPFGQSPFLEVDGKILAQSLAIKIYLAKEFGFYGKTNLESLQIDQIAQLVQEFFNTAARAMFAENDLPDREAVEKVKENESPRCLGYLEKFLKENGTGYFVGNRLTLAEIIVLDVATGMLENIVDINGNYPLLQKNVQTTRAHKNLRPYLESRPATPF